MNDANINVLTSLPAGSSDRRAPASLRDRDTLPVFSDQFSLFASPTPPSRPYESRSNDDLRSRPEQGDSDRSRLAYESSSETIGESPNATEDVRESAVAGGVETPNSSPMDEPTNSGATAEVNDNPEAGPEQEERADEGDDAFVTAAAAEAAGTNSAAVLPTIDDERFLASDADGEQNPLNVEESSAGPKAAAKVQELAQHIEDIASAQTDDAADAATDVEKSECAATKAEDEDAKLLKDPQGATEASTLKDNSHANHESLGIQSQKQPPAEVSEIGTVNVDETKTTMVANGRRKSSKSESDNGDRGDRDRTNERVGGPRSEPAAGPPQSTNQIAALANLPTADAMAAKDETGEIAPIGPSPEKPTQLASARSEGLSATLARAPLSGAGLKSRESGESQELNYIDPARFVSRVTRAFHFAQERGGTLQLRLSPPELGALRLELTVKDGVLNVNLETETAAARRLLLDHLPALRERLAEQNVRVERFDVDIRRDGHDGQQNGFQQEQQQPHEHQPHQRVSSKTASRTQANSANPTLPERTLLSTAGNSGINLVI